MSKSKTSQKNIWFHASSYGEFECILPLITEFKQRGNYHVICSFFSPSGFEPLHNHPLIDHCIYLPFDTKHNMKNFIDQLNPDCLIISQNEYWPNMLTQALAIEIPIYYVGTYVKEKHWWLNPLLKFMTNPLKDVDTIFLQDRGSEALLQKAGFTNLKFVGNPRIDQVIDNKNQIKDYPIVSQFCGNRPVIICGSTLHSDDKILFKAASLLETFKFVIIPHDPKDFASPATSSHLHSKICFQSSFQNADVEKQILIYDTIGDLKYLYNYATIAYVGGGFDKGVHNTLEPAVFQIPVITGPEIQKFNHSVHMHELDVLSTVESVEELVDVILSKENGLDQEPLKRLSKFLEEHAGATKQIIDSINI